MEKSTNPRKNESIRKIGKAFIELLQSQNINEITVIDICKIAKINRSTFYANFIDIYDLADQLRDFLEKDILNLYDNNLISLFTRNDYLKLFQTIMDNQILIKTYFKLGYDNNIKLVKSSDEILNKYFRGHNIDYHIEFFRTGLLSIIKMWLNNNCKESPEEMAEILSEEYGNRNYTD